MARTQMPWIITEYCEGCTSCIAACPKQLLSMRKLDEDAEVPWMVDTDACNGCGLCADACGLGAIAMTEFVEEARARFRRQREGSE